MVVEADTAEVVGVVGYTEPAGQTGFGGTPAAGYSGYRGAQPAYGGRAYTQSGRQFAPVGLITWRI